MKLGPAVEVVVLKTRDDGSGVVSIPIVPETPFIDFDKTSGGGGKGSISASDLEEMVDNFAKLPSPVPVATDAHVGDRGGKAPGFVDGVELIGNTLWATIDLGPDLFKEVVLERAWRAFSIEAVKNLVKPTISLMGWVLTGGVFTNQPATDVHFKIAAADESVIPDGSASVALRGPASVQAERLDMAEEKVISLSSHEARMGEVKEQAAAATQQVADLTSANSTLSDRMTKLEASEADAQASLATATTELSAANAIGNQKDAQLSAVRAERDALQVSFNDAEQKAKADAAKALAVDVKAVISSALDAGVPPALFEGADADAAAWMTARYATLESFTAQIQSLHGIVKLKADPVKSGGDPNADDPKEPAEPTKLSEIEQAKLEKIGLKDSHFDGITTAAEAAKAHAASQAKE